MGVVYRAWDERLRRKVALKLLLPGSAADKVGRTRLLKEARAASALNHPGIVTIYDIGEQNDQLFIVMELVSGRPLRELLQEGLPRTDVLLRLACNIADALVAAHVSGVVHGDIKPENILVQENERIKLLDFGIARVMARTIGRSGRTLAIPSQLTTRTLPALLSTQMTESRLAGTLAYMPPEKLKGQPGDPRGDLFSFGVVLYEMASGGRPFPGTSAEQVVQQILNHAPPPLVTNHEEARVELARIVHRLLEKDPEKRYQSAREANAALSNLRRALELGAPIATSPGGKRAIAVLPFKLLTPKLEDEYLSIAVADAVINHLGASGDLVLRPTSTVMRYVKEVSDPFAAGRELNVQVVVDGSIYKSGHRLRVLVQAWNMVDGTTLFSTKYDFDAGDLFGVQDTVSNELKQALGLKTDRAAAALPPTKNPMAYELYLRGGERLARSNQWDIRTAIEMLDNATKLDPQFADAWARLAISYVHILAELGPSPEWIRKAERAIHRALAISPENPEAQFARARLLWTPAKRFQHRAALRALSTCLRTHLASQQPKVWQSLIFYHVGLLEEAHDGLAGSLQAGPDDPLMFNTFGQIAFCRGDYERAEQQFENALSVDPAGIWGNLWAPTAPLYRNDLERADARIRAGFQLFPGDSMLTSCEALLWAKRRERRKARQAIQKALKGKALVHTHHVWHLLAAAHVVLGEPTRAIALLRDASNLGLPNYPLFRDDPHFQSLTSYPQYLKLLSDLRHKWNGYKREFGRSCLL